MTHQDKDDLDLTLDEMRALHESGVDAIIVPPPIRLRESETTDRGATRFRVAPFRETPVWSVDLMDASRASVEADRAAKSA